MELTRTIFRVALICIFDIHGFDTREAFSMNVYLPTVHKEIYRISFWYSGGKLWNELSDFVKDSTNIETFKRNYRVIEKLNIARVSTYKKCAVSVFIILRPHCSVPCYAYPVFYRRVIFIGIYMLFTSFSDRISNKCLCFHSQGMCWWFCM